MNIHTALMSANQVSPKIDCCNLLALSVFTAGALLFFQPPIIAQEHHAVPMKSNREQPNKIEFTNDIKPTADKTTRPAMRSTSDSQGGAFKENSKTLRDALGSGLKRISISWVTPTETHAPFVWAQETILEALQQSPRQLYGYIPWANQVCPEILATVHYANGRTGELQLARGYMCFQDENGKHWWTRFTNPGDLNPTTQH